MAKVEVLLIDTLLKARTPGAKDKQPRRKRDTRLYINYEGFKVPEDHIQYTTDIQGKFVPMFKRGRNLFHHGKPLYEKFEKARTPGAKDIKPRRRRGAIHNVLSVGGYEKGSLKHPKVDFYHKHDTGDLVLINKRTGDWAHYTNEKGFVKQGSSHEDLRDHLK
jgi:hypothetical protein